MDITEDIYLTTLSLEDYSPKESRNRSNKSKKAKVVLLPKQYNNNIDDSCFDDTTFTFKWKNALALFASISEKQIQGKKEPIIRIKSIIQSKVLPEELLAKNFGQKTLKALADQLATCSDPFLECADPQKDHYRPTERLANIKIESDWLPTPTNLNLNFVLPNLVIQPREPTNLYEVEKFELREDLPTWHMMRKGSRVITQWTISSIFWHEDKEELLQAIARFELSQRERLFVQQQLS